MAGYPDTQHAALRLLPNPPPSYGIRAPMCYIGNVSTPQENAAAILEGVLNDLIAGTTDTKSRPRRCAHACQILGWAEQLAWLQHELDGYPSELDLPWYRTDIGGHVEWRE